MKMNFLTKFHLGKINHFLFYLAFISLFFNSLKAEIPEKPNPPRLVNDFAGILSTDEQNALEQKLINEDNTSSNQFTIVTVETLEGNDIADYAVNLALKWGIGQKEKNNGILILVAKSERKIRIEVGYGLEEKVTDALSKRIIENEIKPFFKEGKYYEGLNAGVDALHKAADGTYVNDKPIVRKKKRNTGLGGFIVAIIIIVILARIFGRNNRGGGGGFLTGWLIGSMLSGGRRGGGFGDFSSGSGSFGGFGGGSFGGGGASGDW